MAQFTDLWEDKKNINVYNVVNPKIIITPIWSNIKNSSLKFCEPVDNKCKILLWNWFFMNYFNATFLKKSILGNFQEEHLIRW